jgi:hypothetical protein
VLIFATWQQISSSDSMSFLYTCASCENFQDLNGESKYKNEGVNGDSFYLWKHVGDDRRVLYIGSHAKLLAIKNSDECKKKFLWVEVFLVELVFVHNSLITIAILQVFPNQFGTYEKVRKPNWDSFHFMAIQGLHNTTKPGVYYFSHIARSLHFKQWDPGGRCSVTKECALDLEILGKLFM